MKALFPLIASYVNGEIEGTVGRLKQKAIFLALIAFFGLVTVAFLLVAAELALSMIFPPLYAALIIAGAAFVICLLLLMVMQILAAGSRRRARERRESMAAPAAAAAAMSAMPAVLRSRKAAVMAGIPLAMLFGYLMAGKGRSKRD